MQRRRSTHLPIPFIRSTRGAPALIALALGLAANVAAALPPTAEQLAEANIRRGTAQARESFAPGGRRASFLVSDFQRAPIAGDVAHYSFRLSVGPGEHDEIRLHRVVRERFPWVPRSTGDAVMLAHGDAWDFETTFLTSLGTDEIPDTQSIAYFLAAGDVDVWGLDFRWSLVPADASDLSFMAGWDLSTDAADLGAALAAARGVRLLTGSGPGKLHLSGYSRGGQTAYAYLNAESQLPPGLRQVAGFIPVDIFLKTDVEEIRQLACDRLASAEAAIAGGEIAVSRAIIALLGGLAVDFPDEPSPLVPFLTNAQLLRLIGADVDPFLAPTFHRTGGFIDPFTLETTLHFTRDIHWFVFNRDVSAFEPWALFVEAETATCDESDSPLDDHLDEITVPVLYVGAAGGFGELGIYNTTLLGSTDVTSLIVRQLPAEELLEDYGHVDLFLADDAEPLAWQPILDWIRDH